MKNININLIRTMENHFINEDFEGNEHYIIKKGNIPVFISAPHSVPQLRLGKIKAGEFRTGVIAQLLYEKTNCYCAFKTKNVGDDANFDDENSYRDEIIELIKSNNISFLLDLHILSPERDCSLDLGTGRGKNIQEKFEIVQDMVQIFSNNNITNIGVDKYFPGSFKNTVSATVARECGICCVQIEMNWNMLDMSNSTDNLRNVINSLEEIIKYLTRKDVTYD